MTRIEQPTRFIRHHTQAGQILRSHHLAAILSPVHARLLPQSRPMQEAHA